MDIGINAQQLRKDWESLHAIPEIGFKEYKTSAYLKERLREMGYQVTPIAGTPASSKTEPPAIETPEP